MSENQFCLQDILDARTRGGREMPITKEYDPKHFWTGTGKAYFAQFTKKEQFQVNIGWIIDKLKTLGCKSVLEAGCGFGRILPFLLESKVVEEVSGFDISSTILADSEEYLKPVELTEEEKKAGEKEAPDFRARVKLFEADVRKIPREDNSTEVVLSCEVLQHLNPDDCMQALREMSRVSSKYILCVERWAYPGERSENHLWSHNISDMFTKLGMNVLQCSTVAQGMQGVVASIK